VLEVNGMLIGMKPEIATYIGQLTGCCPSDSAGMERFDRVMAVLTDITDVLTGVTERDPQRKIAMRMQLVSAAGPVSMKLAMLEELLHDGSTFLAGESVSVADYACWRACGWLASGVLDGVAVDYVPKTFPLLYEHHRRVHSLPEVQEWICAHPKQYLQ